MATCPMCKQTIRAPRGASPKTSEAKLKHDLSLAESAIAALRRIADNPSLTRFTFETEGSRDLNGGMFHEESEYRAIRKSANDEIDRLSRALTDHTLLARIFRRNNKGATYADLH